MEKMEAHQRGVLHRAFSVLVFNSKGELMLQKRAKHKYHSGGLWTNTCCSHPRENESMEQATHRRLIEEMGIDLQPEFLYKFIYRAHLDQNLIEHELDHVYTAIYDEAPTLNYDEVEDWKFSSIKNVRQSIKSNPEQYTAWFKIIMDSYENHVSSDIIR
ncbi:isopentenyl-diphosphate Delta-isomerase [Fulvivirga sp. M361]|nr:isopentenyl-diphosphate Delta-isomerase [Fulvivirga sp. M361]